MTERLPIRVPARSMPTMNLLASMEPSARERLLSAFTSEPIPTSVTDLRRRIEEALPESDEPSLQARGVVAELFGLNSLATSHDYALSAIAEVIAETEGLELSGSQEEFAEFFASLLGAPAVRTISKAAALANEHERLLRSMRIVTDWTPIFDEPSSDPVGGIVMHRLRLTYWNNTDDEEETEIALTTSQLQELAAVAQRAEEKAATVHRLLGKLSLTEFGTEDDG